MTQSGHKSVSVDRDTRTEARRDTGLCNTCDTCDTCDTYHTITHVTHITQGHSRHLLAMLTSRQICRALGSGINKMAIARRLLCRSCPNPEGFEFLIHRLVWIFCNSSFQLVYLSLDSHILIHACMYNVHGKALKHCISNS